MATKFNAKNLRKTVLDLAYAGSTVHIPCAFSIIEILAVLYRSHLRKLDSPNQPGRDYFVLSKGHGVMAAYACFAELGWISEADVKNYCKDGTIFKGLSDAHVPGLEVTSGSLGHGLSVGIGLALAAKLKKTDQFVFAVVGDGEANEGSIWEGILFAAHQKLDNLLIVIDANGFQAMGKTDEVMCLGDLQSKFESFGFDTRTINGHDENLLDSTFTELKSLKNGKPKCIVANTIKGKGVSFMENNNTWHYTRLDNKTYLMATKELGF